MLAAGGCRVAVARAGRVPAKRFCESFVKKSGLAEHGRVQIAGEVDDDSNGRRGRATLLIVRDVDYQARTWSWEVEEVIDRPLDQLPLDLTPPTARLLQTYLPTSRSGIQSLSYA